MAKQLTTQLFIEKALKKHNNKYNYDLVEYKNAITPIRINCLLHGEFLQKPVQHLLGHDCRKCVKLKTKPRKSIEKYLQQVNKRHNNKYNYDKFIYVTGMIPAIIICPKHGEFIQLPTSHLKHGCDKCRGDCLTHDEFIEKVKQIHGNKYGYEKVNYYNKSRPIEIECRKHGYFLQKPISHLRGGNCPKCCGKIILIEELIAKFNLVHNNTYDYSKVVYKKHNEKVIVICKTHGEFYVTPNNHYSGKGCIKCRASKGELKIQSWLDKHGIKYIINMKFEGCISKRMLPFDVYLPHKNILIEYDGEQHNIERTDGIYKGKFNKIREHDAIKTKFCNDNLIKLIRIPHTEFSNIENVLSEILLFNVDCGGI